MLLTEELCWLQGSMQRAIDAVSRTVLATRFYVAIVEPLMMLTEELCWLQGYRRAVLLKPHYGAEHVARTDRFWELRRDRAV
jgi:hypothetical protein